MFHLWFTLLGGSFIFFDMDPSILFLVFPIFGVLWFIYDWHSFVISFLVIKGSTWYEGRRNPDGYYHVYTMTIHRPWNMFLASFGNWKIMFQLLLYFTWRIQPQTFWKALWVFWVRKNVTLSTAHEVGLLHEHKFFASQRKGFWSWESYTMELNVTKDCHSQQSASLQKLLNAI
jgi:hypothetical protein